VRLYPRQPFQEWLKGTSQHGLVCMCSFESPERIDPFAVIDPLRLRIEQHRVAVECDAHFGFLFDLRCRGSHNQCRRDVLLSSAKDLLRLRGQKQIAVKNRQEGPWITAASEHPTSNAQAVCLDRSKHTHGRVGIVTRKNDHLYQRLADAPVDGKQATDEWECSAWRQHVSLVFVLMISVGVETISFEDLVRLIKVEKSTR
jgi:hypothetical protein